MSPAAWSCLRRIVRWRLPSRRRGAEFVRWDHPHEIPMMFLFVWDFCRPFGVGFHVISFGSNSAGASDAGGGWARGSHVSAGGDQVWAG
jgi:hypothetical protein